MWQKEASYLLRPACHKWADMFPARAPLTAPTQTYFSIISFAILLFASDCWKLWRTRFGFFFYKICTAGGKNNESIISPMMAFLAGTPKKQSNCQLLVAWGLLPVFIFPGAHDTFQTFPWHDRHDKVGPFFIWNQYFKSLHMLHNWGSQLCSVTQRRCVYEARWNTKRKTKTGKNCKGIHDKQVWIQLFSLNQNIWVMEINSLDEQQPTQ